MVRTLYVKPLVAIELFRLVSDLVDRYNLNRTLDTYMETAERQCERIQEQIDALTDYLNENRSHLSEQEREELYRTILILAHTRRKKMEKIRRNIERAKRKHGRPLGNE